ncbi:hypothetical protein [Streptomyces sp. AC512_CC834]|nr:hypothetical protein [Streptomyces sp. AC512_CC834]
MRGPVRVTDAGRVAQYEEDGPLPEICTLGSQMTYQALYDDQGVAFWMPR